MAELLDKQGLKTLIVKLKVVLSKMHDDSQYCMKCDVIQHDKVKRYQCYCDWDWEKA
jgi:hypothetical protein